MQKPIRIGGAKRILAILVALALLSNVSLFMPAMPANSDRVYGENGSGSAGEPSLRELYEDVPNGTVLPDGTVLLYYSLWDFEALYKNAVCYGNLFDPTIVPLPFETEEVREEFLDGYRDDTWYLLDIVYSMKLMPAPDANPSEEELEALLAASSFAYVVKAEESGLVSVILSSKDGEEFRVHIEAAEDGEALSASLVQFEEVLTETEITEEEEIQEEEKKPEEDADGDEKAPDANETPDDENTPNAGETPDEEKAPNAGETPDDEKPPVANEEIEDGQDPAGKEPPAESEPNAGENDAAGKNAGDEAAPGETESDTPGGESAPIEAGSDTEGDESAPNEAESDTEGDESAPNEAESDTPGGESAPNEAESDAPNDETSAGPLAVLRAFFVTPVYAAEDAEAPVQDDTPEAEAPVREGAPAEETPVQDDLPEAETPAKDDIPEAEVPADAADETSADVAPGAGGEDAEVPPEGTDETAPESDPAEESKTVIVEGALNETESVLVGLADSLDENIEANPLAALEINARHFATVRNADVSKALFGEQTTGGGLGDALKSALSSMRPSEAYAAGEDGDDGFYYFPMNLYNYMGTLYGTDIRHRYFDLTYDNFNTPARYGTANNPTANYYSNSNIPLKSYFLFNQAAVPRSGYGQQDWYQWNGGGDPYKFNGSSKHGDQNRGSDHGLPGVKQGIAKNELDNGKFAINFATMHNLSLFPDITAMPKENNPVYIYGSSYIANSNSYSTYGTDPNGKQFNEQQSSRNPGMIQAYPNYELPFVHENGYYTFDSSEQRVYLDNDKKLNSVGYTETANLRKGFFPFNPDEIIGDPRVSDYNFGMSMEIPFVMPPGGEVGSEPMIFEFTGDDDMWVYIDDCLVLDIGGIHSSEKGTIDFASKEVTIRVNDHTDNGTTNDDIWTISKTFGTGAAAAPYYTGTGATLAGDALISTGELGGNGRFIKEMKKSFEEIFGAIDSNFNIDQNFEDYSPHTMKIFYMDRAPANSNCKIKLNMPIVEEDMLNVFKFVDDGNAGSAADETFAFDVYTKDAGSDEEALTPPTSDEINPDTLNNLAGQGITRESKIIRKGGSFTVEIPAGGSWVRVIEKEKPDAEYSTIFLGNGVAGAQSGKDSGWIKYDDGETSSLFCVNYKQHPIELTKYKLDGARMKETNTGDEDPIAWQTMEGVTFDLYEVNESEEIPISTDLTTNAEGKLFLYHPYMEDSPALEGGKTYVLKEKEQTAAPLTYYRPAPHIYFTTTGDSVSPKIREIWYYENNVATDEKICYPDDRPDDSEENDNGYGRFVFADETGREIRLYNERLKGKVTVNKTINEMNPEKQGNPIFLFKLEKFAVGDDGERGQLLGTQTAHVEFTKEYADAYVQNHRSESGEITITKPAFFDNLEAGYCYRISELNTMRYELGGEATLAGGGATDVDDDPATVTFLMTDALAKASPAGSADPVITANFTNSREYKNYLSDTIVAVNEFSYNPWPKPSAPVEYEVTIYKGKGDNEIPVATKHVMKNDMINLNGLEVTVSTVEGRAGSIGTIQISGENDKRFYPYTPITGDCTITLDPPPNP